MYFTIDRITAGIAVLLDDNDNTYRIPTAEIPFPVAEGELLCGTLAADGAVTITGKDDAELAARMEARRARRRRR